MKYKCSNGHENFADALPERCPVCGSTLLRVLSGTAAAGTLASRPSGAPGPGWRAEGQLTAPPGSGPVPAAPALPKRRKPLWLVAVTAAAVLVALGVLGGLMFLLFGRADTDRQLRDVAAQYEDAVGVVILAGQKDGEPFSEPLATAWAVGERVFVSNAHITELLAEALKAGYAAFIVLNKNPEKKFRVLEAVSHPKFGQKVLNIEGKEPVVPMYDIGLLRVDAPVPKRFPVASDRELRKLDSGYRVAYLGFPMEGLVGGGVDKFNPVANMQSGIITSTTDWWLSKAPFEKSLLLSHNLAAAGGASGSPLFNTKGQAVGVLSAVNVTVALDVQKFELKRTPSAALINFAQRIDLLRDIYPEYPH